MQVSQEIFQEGWPEYKIEVGICDDCT